MFCSLKFRVATIGLSLAALALSRPCCAEGGLAAALSSITAAELTEHVTTLADDVFEGRSVGSRGGHAAGRYIVSQLEDHDLRPAGIGGGLFQPCERGGRNVLAIHTGSDPTLQKEFIVVGAHYDHVGDGSQGKARGAVGVIHNGADDNASGVAVLLEALEALATHDVATRRSILFAFWDGEEQGLLGSKDWTAQPTVPFDSVRLSMSVDMVGRLRNDRVEVIGSRTGYGLRRLLSSRSLGPLWLDFTHQMTANSDHWPFVERQVPVLLFHTGLHDDYHQPTDDAEKINAVGMEQVGRFLLASIVTAANADELPAYRAAGRGEALVAGRRRVHRRPVGRPIVQAGAQPPRLGIAWRTDDAEPSSVYLTDVFAGSLADAGGLEVGMRIYAINDQPFVDGDAFREIIFGLLDAEVAEFSLLVESRGQLRTIVIRRVQTALVATIDTSE